MKSRPSGHNPNFRVLSGRRSLARNTDSWGFLFGLVNERIGDDVFIDNSTTALPKRSVTLFGQPPSSALHSSGRRAFRSWKRRCRSHEYPQGAGIGTMNGFRASSQAEDNCAAVAFFLSANCLTRSTTGVFADLVSGEKRGNITFESDSPVQVIAWDEADSQLFASPAAYRRDPYGSHFSAVPNSGRSSNPDTCAIHLAPEK